MIMASSGRYLPVSGHDHGSGPGGQHVCDYRFHAGLWCHWQSAGSRLRRRLAGAAHSHL